MRDALREAMRGAMRAARRRSCRVGLPSLALTAGWFAAHATAAYAFTCRPTTMRQEFVTSPVVFEGLVLATEPVTHAKLLPPIEWQRARFDVRRTFKGTAAQTVAVHMPTTDFCGPFLPLDTEWVVFVLPQERDAEAQPDGLWLAGVCSSTSRRDHHDVDELALWGRLVNHLHMPLALAPRLP